MRLNREFNTNEANQTDALLERDFIFSVENRSIHATSHDGISIKEKPSTFGSQ